MAYYVLHVFHIIIRYIRLGGLKNLDVSELDILDCFLTWRFKHAIISLRIFDGILSYLSSYLILTQNYVPTVYLLSLYLCRVKYNPKFT